MAGKKTKKARPASGKAAKSTAKSTGRPWRLRTRRFWLLTLPVAGVVGGAAFLALTIAYYTITLPHPMMAGQDRRPSIFRILGQDGKLLAERGVSRDYIPLDLMPKHLPKAVMAIEDRRFYDHYGIDFAGLLRAAYANFKAGRAVQGGSTITQQLAKNLFLRPDRQITRKIEEVLIAIWLEARLTKSEILELYLNRVYFGAGAYGVENASERYFGKSARNVTTAEAALLAGLLKAPSKFSPLISPGLARSRARVVIAKMQESDALSADDARETAAQSVQFVLSRPSKLVSGMEYAVDVVMEQLLARIGDVRGDLTVETTLDAALQKRAQTVLREHVLLEGEAVDASQGAAVVLDLDGSIRALVGGRSFAESQYNRVTKGRRQPGSAFKPFVFLAAIESGLSPDSIASDEKLTVKGWSPRNYSGEFKGAVTLRDAFAQSINSVAVRLFLDIGRRRVVAAAKRLGITSDLLDGPSLALGTSEVTPLELTNAYVPFANGGTATTPFIIRRVTAAGGQVLMENKPRLTPNVIEPRHVAAMTDMMHHTVTSGTAKSAALRGHAAAGKTGTSQDFRDAWFVGYTGYLVGGVWIGNDNGKPMRHVVGGSIPAKIWRDIMTAAHAERQPKPLAASAFVTGADASPQKPRMRPAPEAMAAPERGDTDKSAQAVDRIDDAFIARAMSAIEDAKPAQVAR